METVLVVLALALVMIFIELAVSARKWPEVAGWLPRTIGLNSFQVAIVFFVGATWDRLFPQLRLWDASSLGTWGGAIAAYLAITFVYYWWHRARHEIPFLWRWLHQLHHSPQRIEILTSFYKHPFEILANGMISSCVAYMVVGVNAEAGALAVLLTGIAELFYHWNISTPYWLGFLIQRPESHCVHHRAGWHRNNFSDLPLWDILFGTFDNPRGRNFVCGFEPDREACLLEMLQGKDVNLVRKA